MSARGKATSIAAYYMAQVARGGQLDVACDCGRRTIAALKPCWACEHQELTKATGAVILNT